MPNPIVVDPANYVPGAALAFGALGADATHVDGAHPLPVAFLTGAASSTPLAGNLSASGSAGPFVPQLGRAIWITLSGTWSGSVAVYRSTDGGVTRVPLTAGGQAWAIFTVNACEPVTEEQDAAASYYLVVTLASGTLTYRVAQ